MPKSKVNLQALVDRINATSNADFVKRLLSGNKKHIIDSDGKRRTHRLGYVESDGRAIVFPEVQSDGNTLREYPFPQSLDRAIARRDTLMMSIPEAEAFTTGYKEYYPDAEFGTGGKIHIKPSGGDKGKSDYKEKLSKFHVIKSDFENARDEQNRASSSLNRYIREYKNPNGYWYWTTEGKRLQRDRAQADSRLLDARNRLDFAKKEIGNATLDEFNNTPYDPMFFWDYVAVDKDSAKKYYVERGIRESDKAQEVIDFFNSYGSSDGFNRIRENQKSWWLKRHPYRKFVPFELKTALRSTNWLQPRMAGLNNGNTAGIFDIDTYTDLSVMRSGNGHGAITVGTIESPEQPYLFALPHEIAHITNTSGFATSPGSIQAEALGQNTNTEDGHDSRPSEKHSDIEALRYMLFKEGIYDSREKEDATAEDIKKLREKYPMLRPLLQMDDEQAAWMINHVADANEKIDMSNIAARGGLIERYGKDKILSAIAKMKQSK